MRYIRFGILTGLLVGSLAFLTHTTFAQQSTLPAGWSLQITGNGSGSQNTLGQSVRVTRTVVQSNTGSVSNAISISSNTGNNSANNTTGGSVSIVSGATSFIVRILNSFNINTLSFTN